MRWRLSGAGLLVCALALLADPALAQRAEPFPVGEEYAGWEVVRVEAHPEYHRAHLRKDGEETGVEVGRRPADPRWSAEGHALMPAPGASPPEELLDALMPALRRWAEAGDGEPAPSPSLAPSGEPPFDVRLLFAGLLVLGLGVFRATGRRPSPAAVAFVGYVAASLLIGEVFPFSRYEMYAQPGYRVGAVLVVEVDGEEVDPARLEAVADLDLEALRYPEGESFGQVYLLDALRHRLRLRSVSSAREGGAPLRVGFRRVRATAEGPEPEAQIVPLAEGRAWID